MPHAIPTRRVKIGKGWTGHNPGRRSMRSSRNHLLYTRTWRRARKAFLARVRSEKSGLSDGWIWSVVREGAHTTKSWSPSNSTDPLRRTTEPLPKGTLPLGGNHDSGGEGADDSDRLEREAIQAVELEQEQMAGATSAPASNNGRIHKGNLL